MMSTMCQYIPPSSTRCRFLPLRASSQMMNRAIMPTRTCRPQTMVINIHIVIFAEVLFVGRFTGLYNGKTAEQQHEGVQGAKKRIGMIRLFAPFWIAEAVQQVAGDETVENHQCAGGAAAICETV